jgi:hypothetical protein
LAKRKESACLARQCRAYVSATSDIQIVAIGRRSFRPIVAAHDRDAAIDDQYLFARDPGAGIDPYRHAGGGERADAFLEIARRTTIGDEADFDAAGMRTAQRHSDAGPPRVAIHGEVDEH